MTVSNYCIGIYRTDETREVNAENKGYRCKLITIRCQTRRSRRPKSYHGAEKGQVASGLNMREEAQNCENWRRVVNDADTHLGLHSNGYKLLSKMHKRQKNINPSQIDTTCTCKPC